MAVAAAAAGQLPPQCSTTGGVLFPHHRQHAGPFGQHKTVPVFAVGPGRLIRGVVAAGQGPHGGKAHKPQSVHGRFGAAGKDKIRSPIVEQHLGQHHRLSS